MFTPFSWFFKSVQHKHCTDVKYSPPSCPLVSLSQQPDMSRPSLLQPPPVFNHWIWSSIYLCVSVLSNVRKKKKDCAKTQWLYSLSVFCVVSRVLVAPRGGLVGWLQHKVLPSCSIEQVWPESMVWWEKKKAKAEKHVCGIVSLLANHSLSASSSILELHHHLLSLYFPPNITLLLLLPESFLKQEHVGGSSLFNPASHSFLSFSFAGSGFLFLLQHVWTSQTPTRGLMLQRLLCDVLW